MKQPLRIFSTKCLKPQVVEAILGLGWELQQDNLIEIRQLPIPEGLHRPQNATWIFTSQNAVESVARQLFPAYKQEVFCLEGATQAAVREMMPDVEVRATAPDAASLATQIIRHSSGPFVLFCGNMRRDDLPERLKNANCDLTEVIVYETTLTPKLIPANQDAILFFSPSAVESFFQLNQLHSGEICFAIGNTTASSIQKKAPDQKVLVATHPSQEAMFDALKQYFQTYSLESA